MEKRGKAVFPPATPLMTFTIHSHRTTSSRGWPACALEQRAFGRVDSILSGLVPGCDEFSDPTIGIVARKPETPPTSITPAARSCATSLTRTPP